MAFNPQQHLMKLKGKDYLEVRWRLVWFRQEQPQGTIATELVHMDDNRVVFKATIVINDVIVASAHGSAPAQGQGSWRGREVEKAETAAVGRALAHAGYGTQFAGDDVDEGVNDDGSKRLADTPSTPQQPSKQNEGQETPSQLLWRADDNVKRLFANDHSLYRVWLGNMYKAGKINADVNVTQLKQIVLQHSDEIVLGDLGAE